MDKAVTEEMVHLTMEKHVKKKPEVKVLIRADKETKHLYVANILSICKSVGVKETHILLKTLK
jgi:biopolymer transport protein ExbD